MPDSRKKELESISELINDMKLEEAYIKINHIEKEKDLSPGIIFFFQ